MKQKHLNLYIFLSGLFLTNALVAEIIGSKIFSLEKTFGFSPAQIELPFFDAPASFNLTAGVILWPVVFVMTDIINEYFGKAGVRKISFLTAGFIAYTFFVFWVTTGLSPADFWVNQYKKLGLDIDAAFGYIFLQGMGIITGSLVAFLIGQLVDVWVFQYLRKFTGHKKLWLRATGSTLVSQFIDSYVVLFVAFYIFAKGELQWSIGQVLAVGTVNYSYKFLVALLLTPSLYLIHYLIDSYLGKAEAKALAEKASRSNLF